MHEIKYKKDANPNYPDCKHEDCYMQMNPVLHSPIINYCPEHEPIVIAPAPKVHANKADSSTSFAATLTMPPGYEPKRPLIEAAKMIMEHGLTNKPYEKATKWIVVLEHADTNAHVHLWYKTNSGRRIASKYFQRYWPLWDEKIKLGSGHKGGYHQKARHTDSYESYLLKEGEIICSP
jgi:hypothetical protein